MRYLIAIALLALITTSCSTTTQLYNWQGYDDAVYAYTKNSNEQSVETLIKIYTKLIDGSNGTRGVPPPGVCADYGYLLVKKGEVAKGKELLIKETQLYPESKPFIERILKRFEN